MICIPIPISKQSLNKYLFVDKSATSNIDEANEAGLACVGDAWADGFANLLCVFCLN